MLKLTLLLSLMFSANAQVVQNPFGGLVDATREAIRIRMQQDRLRMEAENSRSLQNLLDAQAESIRQANAPSQQALALSQQINQEFPSALARASKRFPDFDRYSGEISRLVYEFQVPRDRALNVDRYIEGLYVIAKYASFAGGAAPKEPMESPAAKLVADPEFHGLPMALKIKLLRDVDTAALATYKDEDIETILIGLAGKLKPAK